MTEHLFYVGITHESAPLAIRESMRPDEEKRLAMLERMAAMADGRMVLSTCERFELYATTSCTDATTWVRSVAEWFQLPFSMVTRHVQTHRGAGVAQHLLRVAAGLESRIVGEPQILGQVRDAFLTAERAGALNAELNVMGRAAIRAGKRVRNETTLNAEARSIATIAVDHLERETGWLVDKSVLIVGTGNLAVVVGTELCREKVKCLQIAGRNDERASSLAASHGATALRMDQLPQAIARADVVIACTSAPSHVIDAATIGRERSRPLIVLDLSVPRNVDPGVTQLYPVRLWDLDRLVSSQPVAFGGVAAAGAIVEEELSRFLRWRRERRVAPAIAAALAVVAESNERPDRRTLHQRIVRLKEAFVA